MDPAEKMASKVQLDPAVKMMTATLTKSTKKSGFGRFFYPGKNVFYPRERTIWQRCGFELYS